MAIEIQATPIVRAYRRSALEAAACLYRYLKLYVEGIEDQGDEARRGIAFHLAAELYIRRLVTRWQD